MFPAQNPMSDVARTGAAAQIEAYFALSSAMIQSMERLLDLNLNAMRASIEESAVLGRQFLETRDPQASMTLVSALAKPNTEKALAYSRHLFAIASTAQEEINNVAESQFAETSRRMISMVDQIAKNAPPGSENVVAIVKTAMGNANAGVEQLHKTTRQATEAIEKSMAAAVDQLVKTPDAAVKAATAQAS